jgi:uncharacterized FlaG/YvyC family protein
MSIQLPPAGPPGPPDVSGVSPIARVHSAEPVAQQAQAAAGDRVDTTPSRPPEEVLDQIAAASDRYEQLRAQQRELHFAHDPSTNRVVVEVRDLEGNVLRTIPPSKALDVIAGGPLD